MARFEINSSKARKNWYTILKRVGESGDNYTIQIYKKAKVRVIREELAQILEDLIGKNVWEEIHRILGRNTKIGEETKETIKKILKPRLE